MGIEDWLTLGQRLVNGQWLLGPNEMVLLPFFVMLKSFTALVPSNHRSLWTPVLLLPNEDVTRHLNAYYVSMLQLRSSASYPPNPA